MLCLIVLWLVVLSGLDAVSKKSGKPIVYSYSYTQPTQLSYINEKHQTKEPTQNSEETKSKNVIDKVLMPPLHFAYSDQWPKASEEKLAKGGGESIFAEQKRKEEMKEGNGGKSYHKYAKGQKGLHDKESHKKKYIDKKGTRGQKNEKAGHVGLQQHIEKGRKGAKFGETGEHRKGHHTKGEHNIHKKNEYHKIQEFYDEHHEGDDEEKKGNSQDLMSKSDTHKSKKGHRNQKGRRKKSGKKRHRKKNIKKEAQNRGKKGEGEIEHFEEGFVNFYGDTYWK